MESSKATFCVTRKRRSPETRRLWIFCLLRFFPRHLNLGGSDRLGGFRNFRVYADRNSQGKKNPRYECSPKALKRAPDRAEPVGLSQDLMQSGSLQGLKPRNFGHQHQPLKRRRPRREVLKVERRLTACSAGHRVEPGHLGPGRCCGQPLKGGPFRRSPRGRKGATDSDSTLLQGMSRHHLCTATSEEFLLLLCSNRFDAAECHIRSQSAELA